MMVPLCRTGISIPSKTKAGLFLLFVFMSTCYKSAHAKTNESAPEVLCDEVNGEHMCKHSEDDNATLSRIAEINHHEEEVDEEDFEEDKDEDDDYDYEELQDFLYNEDLRPGEMSALKWKNDSKVAHPFMLEVALPENFQVEMYNYAESQGFIDLFESLTIGNEPLETDSNRVIETFDASSNQKLGWMIQRPKQKYFSNMHWIGAHNEETHNNFLQMLGRGGFDTVLEGLAKHFDLDGLTVVQVTYMGVSFCNGNFFHWDFPDTGGKAFNIIVPVIAGDDTPPELQIQDGDDEERTGGYLYKANRAIVLGDNGMHATGHVSYEDSFRVGATIYVADINEKNVDELIRGFTQSYPPQNDRQWALDHAGLHYDENNNRARLPEILESQKKPFIAPALKDGEFEELRWRKDNKIVSPYTLEVKLPNGFPDMMIDYAQKQGFINYFRELTGDEPLPKDSSIRKEMNGNAWTVQRPNPNYHSNMHWIGPADEETHQDFLLMLSMAGFDSVLESLAKKFNLDGLTIVQVTYMAVSFCDGYFFHWDFPDTGGKAFNIIVPLLGVPGSPAELQIQDGDDEERTAGYKYEKDHAIVFGDNAMHATGQVKYDEGDFRMGATIYVADINEQNVDELIRGFTQSYPPQNDRQWALDHVAMHYDGKGKKIVAPQGGDFLRPYLDPGQVSNLYWANDKKMVHPCTLEAGLPRHFQDVLMDYAIQNGFIDYFADLVGDHPLEVDSTARKNVNGLDWLVQRPNQKYFSNMHWMGPATKETHDDFLKVLSKGGFDTVLEGIAKKKGLASLSVVQVTYMAVSFCDGYFFHWDFPDTGAKAFNIIVPLMGVDGSPPELQIQDDENSERTGGYKYEKDHAIVFGDNAMHATGQVNYTEGFRMGATIYIADITQDNVDELIRGFTQAYPPQSPDEARQWALYNAGLHYGNGNKLPSFDLDD